MITTLEKQSAAFLALTESEGFIRNRIDHLPAGSKEEAEARRVLSKVVSSKEVIRTDLEKAAAV